MYLGWRSHCPRVPTPGWWRLKWRMRGDYGERLGCAESVKLHVQ